MLLYDGFVNYWVASITSQAARKHHDLLKKQHWIVWTNEKTKEDSASCNLIGWPKRGCTLRLLFSTFLLLMLLY